MKTVTEFSGFQLVEAIKETQGFFPQNPHPKAGKGKGGAGKKHKHQRKKSNGAHIENLTAKEAAEESKAPTPDQTAVTTQEATASAQKSAQESTNSTPETAASVSTNEASAPQEPQEQSKEQSGQAEGQAAAPTPSDTETGDSTAETIKIEDSTTPEAVREELSTSAPKTEVNAAANTQAQEAKSSAQETKPAEPSAEEIFKKVEGFVVEKYKLEGEKLSYFLNALSTARGKSRNLKRVVVLTLNEGEKAPAGAVEKDGKYYLLEYFYSPEPKRPHGKGRRFKGKGKRGGKKRFGNKRDGGSRSSGERKDNPATRFGRKPKSATNATPAKAPQSKSTTGNTSSNSTAQA